MNAESFRSACRRLQQKGTGRQRQRHHYTTNKRRSKTNPENRKTRQPSGASKPAKGGLRHRTRWLTRYTVPWLENIADTAPYYNRRSKSMPATKVNRIAPR